METFAKQSNLHLVSNSEEGAEGKKRIGAREKAFAEVDLAFKKALEEDWEMLDLRAYIASLKDGNASKDEEGNLVQVVKYCVAISKSGNRLYFSNVPLNVLKEDFFSALSFKSKKDALLFISKTADANTGSKLF